MKTILFLFFFVTIQCLSWKLTGLDNQVEAQIIYVNGKGQQAAFNKQEIAWNAGDSIHPLNGGISLDDAKINDNQEATEMELVSDLINSFNDFFKDKKWREIEHSGLLTRYHSLAYSEVLLHRYDSYNELKISAGPQLNQELCLSQLEQLVKRLSRWANENKADSNLEQLLDTYGRTPSGMLVGNFLNPGAYFECKKLAIEPPTGEAPQETRYCIAGMKRSTWPKEGIVSELSTKYGICIPRSCDSANYKNKYHLVNELVQNQLKTNVNNEDRLTVTNLYCLPDEDSSIRQWWKNAKSLTFVIVISGWIGLLIFATVNYERMRVSTDNKEINENEKKESSSETNFTTTFKTYEMLAITHNLRQLFNTTKTSSMAQEAQGAGNKKQQLIDLSVLEGIKVICMSYVVMGHVLLYFSSLMNNGREMSEVNVSNIAFFAANMLPAFAVNSFFTITGLLTAYLMFKSGQTRTLVTVPRKYFAFVLYRYLRIMPVYILAVAYAKYFARYTGEGPFWDYGTSTLSPRYRCEQESWLWTLTFTANLKPPLNHCVVSAWYLANDFQFFLITPILLAILDWKPAVGKMVLKLGIMAGYLLGMHSIFTSKAPDLRPVASFMPHGFKTYVTHLNSSYTYPQNRIPAYLCGLFIGYVLYEWEKRRLARSQQEEEESKENSQQVSEYSELPLWLRKHQSSISGLAILSCVCLPLIGSHLNANKFWARVLVTFCMSSYHIIFSLAIGLYVLASVTGNGNKLLNDFLSAPIWKPFSRLSLCVVLFNVEVVNYFVQSSRQMIYMDFKNQTAFNLLCISFSYLSAIFICVTFESPVRAVLNKILASLIKGANKSEKQRTSSKYTQ